MKLPQAITDRYVSNLLSAGHNHEFRIDSILCKPFCEAEVVCGYYYIATLIAGDNSIMATSPGSTPHQALRKALEKAGVTFR